MKLIIFISIFTIDCISGSLSPIVFVPGDGGSQLEANLNKSSAPHFWCGLHTSWFSIWLNLELMIPYELDCTIDNLRLKYNNLTRTTSNTDGVDIRIVGFGSSTHVEWLDPSQIKGTSYFYYMAESFVKRGYERDVNLFGAPYDFRKAPNENQQFFRNITHLVEKAYAMNNNTKVTLLAHSMGCVYMLYFLNHQPQEWKDTYIAAFIALGGPWGGVAKTMRLMASGDRLGVVVLNPLTMRTLQRSIPSSAWLLPYDGFYGKDEILLYGPVNNYTVHDYKRFFEDLNFTDGWDMRQDTVNLIKDLKPPGVEVYCIHGVGVPTPEKFVYSKGQSFDKQPTQINSDGDGTVPLRSAKGCLLWQDLNKKPVHYQAFPNSEHMEILYDARVLQYLNDIIMKNINHINL